jgi:hypothetical protein
MGRTQKGRQDTKINSLLIIPHISGYRITIARVQAVGEKLNDERHDHLIQGAREAGVDLQKAVKMGYCTRSVTWPAAPPSAISNSSNSTAHSHINHTQEVV